MIPSMAISHSSSSLIRPVNYTSSQISTSLNKITIHYTILFDRF